MATFLNGRGWSTGEILLRGHGGGAKERDPPGLPEVDLVDLAEQSSPVYHPRPFRKVVPLTKEEIV